MAKVPADKKDWFEKLMRVAQKGSVFSEEHNWYLDQHVAAISRRIFLEYGRRFSKAGVIDERDDIFYLLCMYFFWFLSFYPKEKMVYCVNL